MISPRGCTGGSLRIPLFKRVAQRYSLLGAAFISDAFDQREGKRREEKVERIIVLLSETGRSSMCMLVMGTSLKITIFSVSFSFI